MAIRIATLILTLCIAPGALSQPATGSAEAASPPEEVLITGERHVYQLRTEMLKAERQAYDIFNRFNDERRFDISCSTHAPTGSRIERQVCMPGFQLEAFQQHALQYLESTRAALGQGGANFAVTYQPQESVIASQLEAYRSKLKQVAEEHPEFLDALIEFTEISKRYEEATNSAPD